jgi:hypothetical protein
MGKGSGRRPLLVSQEEADNNWDNIFGKKKKSADTSPHLVEYELNKSTGELERLWEGTCKPNESQFDGE